MTLILVIIKVTLSLMVTTNCTLQLRLISVPGDGDCFYHSILRNTSLAEYFKNVNSLRLYITGMVSLWFDIFATVTTTHYI